MPRSARLDAPGVLHHVIIRGIERKKIFRNKSDQDDFTDRLATLLPATRTVCYAWALMGNHAHFLFRSGPGGIAGLMRRLLTGYAMGFNRRYRRHGQLFQNRYKSVICQEDAYLKELVRYIHLNPLRAKIAPDLKSLNKHPFCGHGVLMGKHSCDWQDTRYVLKYFGKTIKQARHNYLSYVKAGMHQGRRPELVGGGFIRSAGGWAAVKKLHSKGMDRIKGDQRILGESNFVLEILEKAKERYERAYELKKKHITLETIARKAAGLLNIEPEEIFIKSRIQARADARALYCFWAVRELGTSLIDLAVALKITTSGVSYAVQKGEVMAKERGLTILD